MLITVGDYNTMEVDKEEIERFVAYTSGLKHFLADPTLAAINEHFETLLKLIEIEED